ncbi:thiol-disulfide oxidoreductase [Anoxybacillus gonensis]|uniref:Thiol-disulfide oxidoreductase ResA n=2 Tax=Anoxybacillus TaxID=150247 RepID=A0AAW7TEB1_9BACL|nr:MULTISPECIES: thiol-disulfide oxidoreductase ResA [Anoxybacillus]AKS38741.1 thiol-disulfide oxidoreductase [Anoxybacillus gonensis]KGP60148.1 thiol-disulfide oxidoreductase [Anoxybacillus gonensis]KIQ94649.1 Thiol-disulfide oxidoreductase resA [Anoxybacillus thermarum]MCX8045402.1 thiol-disulfide oxidoreductase ResA [Anoxybacillus gonensis]MDO0876325.1 thiol-disulfide oxidoreductase ResA [Anoxybacillus gonensis]
MKEKRFWLRTVILAIMLAAIGYTIYSNVFVEKKAIQVGDSAPDFVLTDLNGNKIQLSDYRGKGVFLNFWGTWCKPCEKEMPYINSQYNVYKNEGVEVIAVNVGEAKVTVQTFVDRFQLTFPVVIDQQDQVMNAYDINPLPTTFLIDKDGKIVDIITGTMTEEDVKKYMERIKP